jgi:hypothetical protein
MMPENSWPSGCFIIRRRRIRSSSRCYMAGWSWATISVWHCRLPLDVLITRKLGTPSNPELAMGALAETGYRHMNQDVLRGYGVSEVELEEEIRCQQSEIDRRIRRYREGRALIEGSDGYPGG